MGYVNNVVKYLCSILILCVVTLYGQKPKLVLQESTRAINNIVFSPNNELFVIYEGDIQTLGGATFKLYDFDSKIMIAAAEFSSENGPGSGDIALANDGTLYLTTNHEIIAANLIKDIQEPLITLSYPEYIQASYHVNDSILLVSTKTYLKEGGKIDEISNKGKLYLFDKKNHTILQEKELAFEVPYINYAKDQDLFLLATSKGECVFLKNDFTELYAKMKLFKYPPRYLALTTNGYLVANNSIPNDYDNITKRNGEGEIVIASLSEGKIVKKIPLEKQEYIKKSEYDLEYLPNNLVSNIYLNAEPNVLYVSYGFNKLLQLDLNTFTTKDISPKMAANIGRMLVNTNTQEMMLSYGNAGMVSTYDDLSIYDYTNQRLVYSFNNIQNPLKNYKALCNIAGEYSLLHSEKDINWYSLKNINVFHIANRDTMAITTKNYGEEISIHPLSKYWVVYNYKQAKVVEPTSKIFNAKRVALTTKDDDVNNTLFKVQSTLDISNLENYRLATVFNYFEESDTYFIMVQHKKNDDTELLIVNASGEIIQKIASKLAIYELGYASSYNEKYLAFLVAKNKNSMELKVYHTTDWQEVIATTIKNTDIPAISFSTNNQAVYFFKGSYYDNQPNALYKIDLAMPDKEVLVVNTTEYIDDFIVDENQNVLYLNTSEQIQKINLTTQEVLFKRVSKSSKSTMYIDNTTQDIVADLGNAIAIFNSENLEPHLLYVFKNNNNIIVNNEAYYMASAGLHVNQLGYAIGNKGYPYTQFDLFYNRPDLVLQELEFLTSDQQEIYNQAYQKRLKNTNATGNIEALTSGDIPTAKLVIEGDTFTTTSDSVALTIEFKDKSYQLTHWNLWVNGVPIFGKAGEQFMFKTDEARLQLAVKLTKGNNTIQVSCTNSLGVESLKKERSIYCDVAHNEGKLYFIGIGVSKYKNEDYNLTYADKDIRDLEKLFKDTYNAQSYILTNQNATKEAILDLKKVLQQTTVNDKVIISFSGHGLLDESLNFYCATHDVDFDHPEEKGLQYSDIEWLLDGIPSRQNLVFIDACNSGTIDKDEEILNEEVVSNNQTVANTKGSIGTKTKKVTTQDSFTLMGELFSDVSNSNGAVIIAAAGGREFALENEEWQNGAFTFALREALEKQLADTNKDKAITVEELKSFVLQKVLALTNGKQHPISRQSNLLNNFEVIRYK